MKNHVFLSVAFLLFLGMGLGAQDAAKPVSDGITPQTSPAPAGATAVPVASTAPAASTEPAASTAAPVQTAAPVASTAPAPSVAPAATAGKSSVYESAHFSVRSDVSPEQAQALANRLEAYMEVFNGYFRFDLSALGQKLKVKIYGDKAGFDKYLTRLINETRSDYVYLHYSDKARSELVGYVSADKAIPESSLVHQAFIQYLRSFIPNPPLWIREGFAVFFETMTFDVASGKAVPAQNLSWLETYKDLAYGSRTAEALGLDQLLNISVEDARTKISVFYPQAWGLVNYLVQGENKAHNRVLWDAIRFMDPAASLTDNSKAVAQKAFGWEDPAKIAVGMTEYFKAKKTFRELVLEGVELYAAGKLADAEADFTKSLDLQTANHIPYYYLGLINYDKANFAKAQEFYLKALDKGADAALTNYALGVNAFADNQYETATTYLKKVLQLDATYGDKVKEIMDRMEV